MQSHIVLLVVFAFLVSLVFALLSKEDPRAQIQFGARLFGIFVASAVVLGWLLYPLPF
jgi:heme/copper-type cytochrome/quinol oxidase subunit 4